MLIKADIFLLRVIAVFAIVKALNGTTFGALCCEIEPWGEHLLHEQACGNGLERIVHGLGDCRFSSIRFGNQVGETGTGLADRVTGGAADNLHDFSQAGAVTDGQRVFAPNPVKAFLGHSEGDDDVHMVAVVLLGRVFQGG